MHFRFGRSFVTLRRFFFSQPLLRLKTRKKKKKKNRPVPDSPNDPTLREVRLSCPDATGLGCDAARVLLDCGLAVRRGDVSTDGRWCFMVFLVRAPLPPSSPSPSSASDAAPGPATCSSPSASSPLSEIARGQLEKTWEALRRKLQAVAPQAAGVRPSGAGRKNKAAAAAAAASVPAHLAAPALEKPRSSLSRDEKQASLAATELAANDSAPSASTSSSAPLPFVVRVCGAPDTRGTLHALVDALWAADLTVYRAEAGFKQGAASAAAAGGRRNSGGGGGAGSTSPGRSSPSPPPRFVADSFWVLDNRGELPDPNRAAEVRAAVREALERQQRKEEKEREKESTTTTATAAKATPTPITTPTKTSVIAVPVLRSEATCTIAPAALDDDDGDETERKGGSSSVLETGLGGLRLDRAGPSSTTADGGDSSHKTPPSSAPLSGSNQASPPRSFPPSRRNCANSAAAVPLRDAAVQRRRAALAAASAGAARGGGGGGGSTGGGGGALSKAASSSPERRGGSSGHLFPAKGEPAAAAPGKAASSAAGSGEEEEEIIPAPASRTGKPEIGSDGDSDDDGSDDFDEFAWDDAVNVDLDNTTARSYSVLSVTCADRKGLVYDLMRTLKDVAVRVVSSKNVFPFFPFFFFRRRKLTFFSSLVFQKTKTGLRTRLCRRCHRFSRRRPLRL